MNDLHFNGPLFVVGMPRSGTKLLRDLLNRHPNISIAVCESHFIPYFLNKYGQQSPFKNIKEFDVFIHDLKNTNFIWDLEKEGYPFDEKAYLNKVDVTSWQSIFSELFKQLGPKGNIQYVIWGDKTPGYVWHIKLLKALFQDAKFIHIIRDPRDYSISVRNAWGKSLFRAAYRWAQTLEFARKDAEQLKNDYIEVKYEDLVSDPEAIMSELSGFLQIEYSPAMTTLEKPSENLGDTKGANVVVATNTKKYLKRLKPSELKRIEEMVCIEAEKAGYIMENKIKYRSVNFVELLSYKLYDGWSILTFQIKEHGLFLGLKYFFNTQKLSSWK